MRALTSLRNNVVGSTESEGDSEFKEAVEQEKEEEERFEEAQEQVVDKQEAEPPAVDDIEDQLQKDDAAVKAELAKIGAEAALAARADKEVEPKPPDPALDPPAAVRPDWEADVEKMKGVAEDASTSDDRKIKELHEALVQRIEDSKVLDEHKATTLRRLIEASKERDRCRGETQRALQAKTKLEGNCRELQSQKLSIAKENQKTAEEEQSRHSELKEKFEQAIKDVQEKMDAELEVRQHFLKENEELRGKLQKFTETYEAQEKQLAEQRESRGREMEVAEKRLEEHEVMCSESKIKTAKLEKDNEALRKSQTILRAELQTILSKFDEFHEAVTGSNQLHGDCKVEIDTLQQRLQELEKENADLKNCSQLNQATEEQKVAQKQRDALEKLCLNLEKENKKLDKQRIK
jgi:sulfur relay (sulfurtransferase) complex TusBCD TusD component (DsrE family)